MSSAPIFLRAESDYRAGGSAIACCLHRRYVSCFNVLFEIPETSRLHPSSDDCQLLFLLRLLVNTASPTPFASYTTTANMYSQNLLGWLAVMAGVAAAGDDAAQKKLNVYDCTHPPYKSHLLSKSPLVIYMENFVTDAERLHLQELAYVKSSLSEEKRSEIITNKTPTDKAISSTLRSSRVGILPFTLSARHNPPPLTETPWCDASRHEPSISKDSTCQNRTSSPSSSSSTQSPNATTFTRTGSRTQPTPRPLTAETASAPSSATSRQTT